MSKIGNLKPFSCIEKFSIQLEPRVDNNGNIVGNKDLVSIYKKYISRGNLTNFEILMFDTFINQFCIFVEGHEFSTETVNYYTTSINDICSIMSFLKRLNIVRGNLNMADSERVLDCIKKLFLVISDKNFIKWTLGEISHLEKEEDVEVETEDVEVETEDVEVEDSTKTSVDISVNDMVNDVIYSGIGAVKDLGDIFEDSKHHDIELGLTNIEVCIPPPIDTIDYDLANECKCNEDITCVGCKDDYSSMPDLVSDTGSESSVVEKFEVVGKGINIEEVYKEATRRELEDFRENWKKEIAEKNSDSD